MLCWASTSFAQDLEPRRWAQMPTGLNFAGIGYGYIDGDIFFDPLLLVEEATFDMHRVGVFYMRSLSFLGKSARVDFLLPYVAGRDAKNNPSGNWLSSLSFGFPIDRRQGIKVALLRGRTQKPTGADIDSLIFAYSIMF